MDKLKEMLMLDPCYEQHIVSIKNAYENYLFDILIPAIYEGFKSLYNHAQDLEQKYIAVSKKNPDVVNPGILVLFQTLIKDLPNLNKHKIRIETDRIKTSSKTADNFDYLVKAVCKANIIFYTYNIDHKRKDLLKTKYHESVIVYDFVHSCYIQCARTLFGCVELFYHKYEPIVLNENKRKCFKLIKKAIEEAIRIMLPMREIIVDYVEQDYRQKDKVPVNQYCPSCSTYHNYHMTVTNPNLNSNLNLFTHDTQFINDHNISNHNINIQGSDFSLVDENDDYEYRNQDLNQDQTETNTFEPGHSDSKITYSLLLSTEDIENENADNLEPEYQFIDNVKPDTKPDTKPDNTKPDKKIPALKFVDLSNTLTKKSKSYFDETLPDIKKRLLETLKNKSVEHLDNPDDITITKSHSVESDSSSDKSTSNKETSNKETSNNFTSNKDTSSSASSASLAKDAKAEADKKMDGMIDNLLK